MKPTQRILKVFVFLFCVLAIKPIMAQNVGISTTNGFTPDASAALDISYTNKGLLVPRVALTATNAAGPITSPATSLLVYNTATAGTSPNNVVPGYYYWNGSAWSMLTTSTQAANFWATTGNAGTSYLTNFLGTTDNQSLRFRTNNAQRFLLDSLGNAAIGLSPTFSSNIEKLLVDAGTTSSFNVISGKGNLNNYLQLNIQNNNAGTAASSDVVATADNGSETVNYVDMGINSSANTAAFFGAANDAYLYNAGGSVGGNFFIGTSTSGKVLGFMTGGGATTNERMRIDGSGNVGIGNTAPSQKLDITGNLKFSGALMPNNNAGTAGYFLQSAGAGAPPVWFNAGNLVTSQAWGLLGNAGTSYLTNFLGTTDNQSLRVRTNNVQRFLVDSLGSVAVGLKPVFTAGVAREKFLVDGGSTSANPTPAGAFNVISGKGYLDNYLQLNIQNNSPTANASSDVVATADNGNETTNFVDMGINSSANTAAFFGAANDAYLYNSGGTVGGNFFIGNSTSGKILGFMTGGGATTNERMRIDGSGNVGIGTTAPATKLHIVGTNPLTLNGVQTGTNTSTDSLLTLSSGLVRKLPIATFASAASWSITGNTGTTAGTNFIGTTDATDMVFKTSGNERIRIVDAANATTGTTGDVVVGSANSGTLRANKEIILRQDGDTFGPSTLRLRNRNGQNGAVFETTGGSANLVDFVFNTGPVATPISSNLRFETRSGNMKVTGNSTEWQFGQPDGTNGGPTLVIGAYGTGSNSAFLTGKVGIGTNSPATKLHVFGANPLTLSGVVTGTSTTADSLLTITNGLVRKLPISTFTSTGTDWLTTGNTGTTAGTNFIGTTDAVDFVVKTGGTEKARFANTGDVSIGGTAFNSTNPEQLLVDAGTTTSFNVISGKGNVNNYLQLNIQNNNAGTTASSDVVASADNGTETANYVDMGINSSANTAAYFGAANDAYLYNAGGTVGGNFFIGTSSSGKSLAFMTGGGATTNERMRILGTGQVGIGTTTPAADLTLYQSSGTGTSRGFRFTGNSIGGVSSGTGFAMSLGYNSANNKQLWLGDADYLSNSAGTFVRFSSSTGYTIIDAIDGANGTRKPIALGVGSDPTNSTIILGSDLNTTTPSSYVWANGNMAIGNGYRANAAPTNGLLVQGNVGVGITSPTATLHLKAGTATASTAPLKLTAGTNLTTAEAGAVEFDGTNYFATSGTVRYTLAKTLTATATLDFASTAANTSSNLTVTVTGAADGDVVFVGAPNGSVVANSSYTAYVSAANTVTVKFVNSSTAAIDPASGTFRVSVIKY